MLFHQRRTTRNPRNLRGPRVITLSSQTLQKKKRVRARRRLPAARTVVDCHSIYYQNLYQALTFTMDTDTGGGHQSSLYVDVVVRNIVTLFNVLFARGANLRCRPAVPSPRVELCSPYLDCRCCLLLSPPPLLSLALMALPAVDPDPDPTTQIPWPGARKRSDRDLDVSRVSSPPTNPTNNNSSRRPSVGSKADANGKRRRLSTLDLVNLSISMAGAQIAWTVELG
jgi:hypothetical protein